MIWFPFWCNIMFHYVCECVLFYCAYVSSSSYLELSFNNDSFLFDKFVNKAIYFAHGITQQLKTRTKINICYDLWYDFPFDMELCSFFCSILKMVSSNLDALRKKGGNTERFLWRAAAAKRQFSFLSQRLRLLCPVHPGAASPQRTDIPPPHLLGVRRKTEKNNKTGYRAMQKK